MPNKKNEVTPEEVTNNQTGAEVNEAPPIASGSNEESGEKSVMPQTDLDSTENPAAGEEDAVNQEASVEVPQTDKKNLDNIAPEPGMHSDAAEGSASSQTEPEKPKRTRRRKASQEETPSESGTEDVSDDKINPDGPEGAPKKASATPRVRPSAIVSIDDQRSVEIEADRERNALLDLTESMKSQKLMTGTIQGIEHPTHDPMNSLAVTYHEGYKIIIPVKEFVEPPADLKEQQLETVLNYMMNKRMGAEVDYIVKGIDAEAKVAVASRVEAMRAKRKAYYFGSDRDGNNLLYSDLCAEARVVSVVRSGIFVDLFGLEVFISIRELSYQRMISADGYFQTGQRILVKILEIDRKNRENIKVKASVKQAGENPYEKALRKYTVGNRYVGTVSLVDTNGVFVSLDGGIDCLCNYPKRGRPPRGARVTVRILGINHNSNRIWGAITHIASAR